MSLFINDASNLLLRCHYLLQLAVKKGISKPDLFSECAGVLEIFDVLYCSINWEDLITKYKYIMQLDTFLMVRSFLGISSPNYLFIENDIEEWITRCIEVSKRKRKEKSFIFD